MKLIRESLIGSNNNNELNIATISLDEIYLQEDNIKDIFADIAEGVDEINIDSYYSIQTREYTNTATIIFHPNFSGSLNPNDLEKIKIILDSYVQRSDSNGLEEYQIFPDQIKVELYFDEQYELV